MYEGFKRFEIQTSDPEVKIVGRVGGKGPAVLLIHGNPLTHAHWHLVAPRLAQDFTVVATDLRGYGDSGKPRGREDHSNYSFRRMAQDQVDVMQHLGFRQFFVAGHDRGARTAHRMALDHPDTVKKFASFDILPTHHVLTNITRGWALGSFHWFFMAQPYDIPEKLIEGKEDYYILNKLTKMGIGKGGFSKETLSEYARAARRRTSTACARTTARRSPSTSRWTRPTSRPGARWPARPRSTGAKKATPRNTSTRARPGRNTARTSSASGRCRAGTTRRSRYPTRSTKN